jgi:hypothetical protein
MAPRGYTRLGYVPHGEVLSRLAEGHWVMCLLDDITGTEKIYPAKIFELMMLDRRVLTLAPEGVLSRLVQRHRLGPVHEPRDSEAIAALLERELRAFRQAPAAYADANQELRRRDAAGIAQYDRRALAERFAEVLHDAAGRLR